MIQSRAASNGSTGCHPKQLLAFEASNLRKCASGGCNASSRFHVAPLPHELASLSAIQDTGLQSVSAGPKFQPDAKRLPSCESRSASIRYPRNGSKTNCHGRMAEGLRIKQGLPARKPRTRSGISWSAVQSPPPMAFPARADASATPWRATESRGKKESRKAAVTNSEHPFEFE